MMGNGQTSEERVDLKCDNAWGVEVTRDGRTGKTDYIGPMPGSKKTKWQNLSLNRENQVRL